MRSLNESLPIGENGPAPAQLFFLASRGVLLAKRYDKFRTMPRSVVSRSHSMLPRSRTIMPDLLEAPFGYQYEHRMSARIARTHFRTWSMRLLSTYMVTEMGSQRGAERHSYKFEWNDRAATLAEHRLRVIPTVDRDLCDDIDNFAARDDIADEWYWRTQLSQMTAGDVELLTRELQAFYELAIAETTQVA